MSNIKIKEDYQLNSILDIYQGNNQNKATALDYYTNHNIIKNGIVLPDKVSPVNGMHSIKNTYQFTDPNEYDSTHELPSNNLYNDFYPLLSTYSYFNILYNSKDLYKLISAKDIDFENAYLKYANQTHNYHEPMNYYELKYEVKYDEMSNSYSYIFSENEINDSQYIFDREISPYINNSYDLLNIVDFLLNRVNALNCLMRKIKDQKAVINTMK